MSRHRAVLSHNGVTSSQKSSAERQNGQVCHEISVHSGNMARLSNEAEGHHRKTARQRDKAARQSDKRGRLGTTPRDIATTRGGKRTTRPESVIQRGDIVTKYRESVAICGENRTKRGELRRSDPAMAQCLETSSPNLGMSSLFGGLWRPFRPRVR